MRVISVNVNGIRAAARKGFFDWLKKQNADFVCIQETKAQKEQLIELDEQLYFPEGYYCDYVDAEKKGYSGVAIYSKLKPKKTIKELGWDQADSEGRYIEMQFDGFSIVSIYLPSGSSGDERQAVKFDFMEKYEEVLKSQRRRRSEVIICGDWNIVHKEIDIKNWKSNQKNSGCLPEERAWLDTVFDGIGFVDAFRVVNQKPLEYTWWSNRGRARENNVGWRIDYQMITPGLRDVVKSAHVYKEEWFSDHAPLIVDYNL